MKHVNAKTKKEEDIFYRDFLRQIFQTQKPLAKLFKTASDYFLYDGGTNKILECRKEVFDLLQGLLTNDVNKAQKTFSSRYGEQAFLKAANDIVEAVKKENILRVKKASQFGLSDHFANVEKILNSFVQSINLEVTQDCNLRCRYCVYNNHFNEKRNYGKKEMSLEVAKKAIRFLKAHSSKSDLILLGVYGGEPLMRPAFIKDCVDYARKIIDNRQLLFNMTTNATFVTREIAEYLFETGFSITASLDGPQVFHDRYRTEKSGNGSYERTIRGLKILAETYTEIQNGQLSINMVYTPPYSAKKLDIIREHLKELDWLPKVNVTTSYPNDGSIPEEMVTEQDLDQDKDLMQWAVEQYRSDFSQSDPMVKGIVEQKFARLLQRSVLTEPDDSYPLNGCCVPGQRKNFITPDGTINICEKMPSDSPPIGNVNSGFDIETIKNFYIDNYAEKSIRYCSQCWAIKICDLCYVAAFNETGELDFEKKGRNCRFKLNSLEKLLTNVSALLKENPERLNYLYQYDIT